MYSRRHTAALNKANGENKVMASIFDLFKQIESEKHQAGVSQITHIVAGLGNPGSKYAHTRHNCGFDVMDIIAEKLNIKVTRARFDALTAEAEVFGKRILFMKPQLYMNRSGESIRQAANFYKIPADHIIVIFDDVSLEPGKLRVKRKGSAGGHNGIKDIIANIGTDSFPRIKVGVGSPPVDGDMINWVLGGFSENDKILVKEAMNKAYDALETIFTQDIDKAMNLYNR